MKHILNELRELFAHICGPHGLREAIAQEAGYRRACENQRFAYARALASHCAWFFGALLCCFTDHRWIDDSYGGPESGCMAGHCERCGYSFHHTLY